MRSRTEGRLLVLAALLAAGPAGATPPVVTVTAAGETAPVAGDADDPAIWAADGIVRILATDKTLGLFVFDLEGRELQRFADGRMNNVDVRPFGVGGLAGATRREDDTIAFWRIAPDGTLARAEPFLHPGAPPEIADETDDIYGFALARHGAALHAIVNFKSGHVVQWEVGEDPAGRLTLTHARTWRVGSQPEGMVADDAAGHLYVGEEDVGIWRFPLDPAQPAEAVRIDRVGSPCLPRDDVEGLAVYDAAPEGPRLLVASAQGIHRVVLYDLAAEPGAEGLPCLAHVAIAAGAIDGVTETDGLDATARALPGYPAGLLVVMDDQNEGFTTNFKLVDWAAIAAGLPR